MPDAHARFAPSASDRWINCPGSILLTEELIEAGKIPAETNNEPSLKGTLMHNKSEEHLLEETDPAKDDEVLWVKKGGFDVTVPTEEWHPHVLNYVNFVRDSMELLALLTGETPKLKVEHRVKIFNNDCWGSVDAHWYTSKILYVHDLKTGYHVVDPATSAQFKTYAVGLCLEHNWKFEEVWLGRSQLSDEGNPNACVKIPIEELKEHYSTINIAVTEGRAKDPDFEAGSHCKYCPASQHCTLQFENAVSIFDDEECTDVLAIDTLDDAQLKRLLELKPVIEDYLKAVQNHITDRFQRGETFEGYKLVAGRSSRKYNPDMLDQVVTLAQTFGVNPYRPEELRTFTDLEKELGKGSLDQFLIKPPGKPTLVPESDKRKAISVASVFDDDTP